MTPNGDEGFRMSDDILRDFRDVGFEWIRSVDQDEFMRITLEMREGAVQVPNGGYPGVWYQR